MKRIRIERSKVRRPHAGGVQADADMTLAVPRVTAERGRALRERLQDVLEELDRLLDETG
jgi:hypothetical protein